jgi:hypothetical protein
MLFQNIRYNFNKFSNAKLFYRNIHNTTDFIICLNTYIDMYNNHKCYMNKKICYISNNNISNNMNVENNGILTDDIKYYNQNFKIKSLNDWKFEW